MVPLKLHNNSKRFLGVSQHRWVLPAAWGGLAMGCTGVAFLPPARSSPALSLLVVEPLNTNTNNTSKETAWICLIKGVRRPLSDQVNRI